MRGSVAKEGDRWYAVIYEGVDDATDGDGIARACVS